MMANRVLHESPDPRRVVQSLFGLSVNELAREIRENKKGKYAALYRSCGKEENNSPCAVVKESV